MHARAHTQGDFISLRDKYIAAPARAVGAAADVGFREGYDAWHARMRDRSEQVRSASPRRRDYKPGVGASLPLSVVVFPLRCGSAGLIAGR
jgi:hypothetical protein